MSKRASHNVLGELHIALAQSMLERLNSGENLAAAEWQAISKFLKDNNIEATISENSTLDLLAKHTIPDFDNDEAWDGKAA